MKITKRKVMCPVCQKGRLMDINDNVKVEVVAEEIMPDDFNPQYFGKCCNCKSIIAIKIQSEIEEAVKEWAIEWEKLMNKYNIQLKDKVSAK